MSSLHLHFDPSYDSPLLKDRILEIFSGNLRDATEVESSHYARVFRFELNSRGKTKAFFYKEFLFRNTRDRLSVLLRPSRAMRAWEGGHVLSDNGLSTATPVCIGESMGLGIVHRNFLVTKAIPGGLDMGRFFTEEFRSKDYQRIIEKRKFICQCGRTIGKMHRLGIFQGDLRAGNILIQSGDPTKINLIDNERTRLYQRLPDRKRLKNLAQINMTINPVITRADRARFFLAYLEENPDLLEAKKTWMQRVLKKTRKRLFLKGLLAS